jgi:hypothetical protein
VDATAYLERVACTGDRSFIGDSHAGQTVVVLLESRICKEAALGAVLSNAICQCHW